jgi:hypothetical protein
MKILYSSGKLSVLEFVEKKRQKAKKKIIILEGDKLLLSCQLRPFHLHPTDEALKFHHPYPPI